MQTTADSKPLTVTSSVDTGANYVMPSFPIKEADIMTLARSLIDGITHNRDDFPSPPVSPEELENLLTAFLRAQHEAVDTAAAAQIATEQKRKEKERLVKGMKRVIRYAESAAYVDDIKLKAIGWGAKRKPRRLEPPGQVSTMKIVKEGPGWIVLDWKAPPDGGEVAAYDVRRYREGQAEPESVALVVEPPALLNGQERKVEWEYAVIAVNKAGRGSESGRVTATL